MASRDRLVNRFVNKTTGSSRKGESFKVVTRGGKRYHDYGGGRLIPDKSGPPSAPVKAGPGASNISNAAARAGRAGRQVSAPATTAPVTPTASGPVRTGGLGQPSWAGTTPAGKPTTAIGTARANATGTGNRLNIAANNPRQGQRFNVVQRGGQTLHKYAPGRVFTGQAAGPGSVAYRKPRRKPPLPPGARTSGFGSTSWSQR